MTQYYTSCPRCLQSPLSDGDHLVASIVTHDGRGSRLIVVECFAKGEFVNQEYVDKVLRELNR